MKGKLGVVLFCLLFAIPFGGVGVFASWMIATMIRDGYAARDWVKVRATVDSPTEYHYAFKGRDYASRRLGLEPLGGTDDIDDWHAAMADVMGTAMSEKKPITVFVDPDNPAVAVIDREIRWKLVLFLTPFALAFGGVGLGALYFGGKTLFSRQSAEDAPKAKPRTAAVTKEGSGLLGLWAFTFIWNAISIPIALLAVPQAVHDGEWFVLLVLLFPIFGLLMLWSAIASTLGWLRRGGASIAVTTSKPRVGAPLEGTVAFPRGVKEGEAFTVKLTCLRESDEGDDETSQPYWTRETTSQARPGVSGYEIPFRFDVPRQLPPTSDPDSAKAVTYRWRLEAQPADRTLFVPPGTDVDMGAAPPGEAPLSFDDEPVAAATSGASIQAFEALVGAKAFENLTPRQKQALATMTPAQAQSMAKVTRILPKLKYYVIGFIVFVVLLQFAPLIVSFI